jgi:hypothetical protein
LSAQYKRQKFASTKIHFVNSMREKLNKMPLCLPVSIFFSLHWLSVSVKQGTLKGKHSLASMHAEHIPHVYALSYFYDIILGHRQLWKNFITFVVHLKG